MAKSVFGIVRLLIEAGSAMIISVLGIMRLLIEAGSAMATSVSGMARSITGDAIPHPKKRARVRTESFILIACCDSNQKIVNVRPRYSVTHDLYLWVVAIRKIADLGRAAWEWICLPI